MTTYGIWKTINRINTNWPKTSFRVQVTTLVALLFFAVFIEPSLGQIQEVDVIERIAWSPDGSKIAIAGGGSSCDPSKLDDYAVRIFNVATRQITNRFRAHTCQLVDVSWSPDGSRIASSGMDGYAFIQNSTTGQFMSAADIVAPEGMSVMWSPDGTKIASIGGGG